MTLQNNIKKGYYWFYIGLESIFLFYTLIYLSLNQSGAYIDTYLDPAILNFTHYSILACFGLFLINSFKQKLIVRSFDVLATAFLALTILSHYIIAKERDYSINLIEIFALFIFYLTIRKLTKKGRLIALVVILLSGIYQSFLGLKQVYGLEQSHHALFNMTGSFLNPAPFAGYIATCFAIAFSLYLSTKPKPTNALLSLKNTNTVKFYLSHILQYVSINWLFIVANISLVLSLIVLPASKSRASWVSIIVVSVISFVLTSTFFKTFISKLSTAQRLVLNSTVTIILLAGLSGLYFLKKDSANGRLIIWNATANIIKANPIIGVGFNKYQAHYMNYQATYLSNNKEASTSNLASETNYAYNSLLRFIAETGAVGGMLVLTLFILCFRVLMRYRYDTLSTAALSGFIAVVVFSLFSYPEHVLPIKITAVACLGLTANIGKGYFTFSPIPKTKYSIKIAALLILLGAQWSVKPHLFRIGDSIQHFQQANIVYRSFQYEASIKEYVKAYDALKHNGTFLLAYGKALAMTKQYDNALVILEEAELKIKNTILYTTLGDVYSGTNQKHLAEICYLKAGLMVPHKFYPRFLLAKLYLKTGDEKKGRLLAYKLIHEKEKISSEAINQMRSDLLLLIDSTRILKQNKTE